MPVFFHLDLDAFYASVEQLDFAEYRGRPVIVGAAPGGRGVVAACSYEARVFGVRSAMPISEAARRCPGAVFLPVRMRRYAEVSSAIMRLFCGFTPSVRQISIDEASLDMTGTERLFGPPLAAGLLLKKKVKEITGLTLSIGIGPNRFIAKMASDYKKPDGLYEVEPGKEADFIDRIGIEKIWGIGNKTLERLGELNLDSVKKLRPVSESTLINLFGKSGGSFLFKAVRGIDPGMYADTVKSHSISSETTFPEDTKDPEIINTSLLDLSHQVMYRLFDEGSTSKTPTVKIRFADFTTLTLRRTQSRPVCSAEELRRHGSDLIKTKWDGAAPLRLVGIGLDAVETTLGVRQGELFQTEYDRKGIVERTIFSMRQKNPRVRVVKASLLQRKEPD
jgi:DNA polymerase-4